MKRHVGQTRSSPTCSLLSIAMLLVHGAWIDRASAQHAAEAGLGDDVLANFGFASVLAHEERAHAEGCGGAAGPVGSSSDKDVLLPHVFDVPERRRHSDHPPAGCVVPQKPRIDEKPLYTTFMLRHHAMA
jgi:hypothetical protein